MRILFLHDNFPAQFGAFGQYLARQGWEVWFGTKRKGSALDGIRVFNYQPQRGNVEHPYPAVASYDRSILSGQAVARVCLKLKRSGFTPDIVVAHSGWGPGLFVKDIWPTTKYVGYFEWYYRGDAPDLLHMLGADPPINELVRSRARNASLLADLASCDAGICPTHFQKEQFPACFHDKLVVMHDGIDTEFHRPDSAVRMNAPGLGQVDEVITYVARGMEPYRGFPEFIAMLQTVLRARPKAHAVIVGEDVVAYGKQLPKGDTYKTRAMREHDLDWGRVHFTGLLPRARYLNVLQASSVHAYLTVPFVLSWSMLEAMSAGCAIVAADVPPVQEIAAHDPAALHLVNSREPDSLAAGITSMLEDRSAAKALGVRARKVIEDRYAASELYRQKMNWLSAL